MTQSEKDIQITKELTQLVEKILEKKKEAEGMGLKVEIHALNMFMLSHLGDITVSREIKP